MIKVKVKIRKVPLPGTCIVYNRALEDEEIARILDAWYKEAEQRGIIFYDKSENKNKRGSC